MVAQALSSEDPLVRLAAVQGASSMVSPDLHEGLLAILDGDESVLLRERAAYALGQQKDEVLARDLIRAFQSQDTANYNTSLRATILEAVGKCGDTKSLDQIASAAGYSSDMGHLITGQARAIYPVSYTHLTLPTKA